MEEKNLEEKDPKNNMDSKQTKSIEESNLDGEKNSNSDLVENINYKLSFEYEVKNTDTITTINNLNINQIKDYINKNYYEKFNKIDDIDRDKLIKDLVVFRGFKEELEINLKNEDLFSFFMMFLLNITSVVLNLNKSLQIVDSKIIVDTMFLITIILGFSIIWLFIRTGKKSDSSRLKVVNYGLQTLEVIKEEIDAKKKD